jgi:hypothetical protein
MLKFYILLFQWEIKGAKLGVFWCFGTVSKKLFSSVVCFGTIGVAMPAAEFKQLYHITQPPSACAVRFH